MVAAGVGMTLLPELATIPPVAASEDVVLVPFADPVPRREVALYWRRSSAFRDFLPDLADVIARSSGR
jgi:LysR family hydrogen peroxide-inducible transcriptional activator